MKFETLAARGGRDVSSASRPLTAPIYQTNVYVFEDMDTVESVWEGKRPGFVYGRYGTANHTMLEELVARLRTPVEVEKKPSSPPATLGTQRHRGNEKILHSPGPATIVDSPLRQ